MNKLLERAITVAVTVALTTIAGWLGVVVPADDRGARASTTQDVCCGGWHDLQDEMHELQEECR